MDGWEDTGVLDGLQSNLSRLGIPEGREARPTLPVFYLTLVIPKETYVWLTPQSMKMPGISNAAKIRAFWNWPG
jgi:hypothetical protein